MWPERSARGELEDAAPNVRCPYGRHEPGHERPERSAGLWETAVAEQAVQTASDMTGAGKMFYVTMNVVSFVPAGDMSGLENKRELLVSGRLGRRGQHPCLWDLGAAFV